MHPRCAATVRCLFIASIAGGLPLGCRSPFADRPGAIDREEQLMARIDAAVQGGEARQMAVAPTQPAPAVGPAETAVDRMLSARRDELNAIGPQSAKVGSTVAAKVSVNYASTTNS